MAWTTADLLTSIKNRAMFPDASTGSLSPSALLQYATEELHSLIVPSIMKIREKYYETYQDTAYSTATTTLAIPARSIGGTLSAVQFLYGPDIRPLEPIDPCDIITTVQSMTPECFYYQNNSIVPYPPPLTSYGTIRMRYFQRPNRLEQISNCTQITAFNSTTMVATCTPPTTWTTANIFDFIPQTASQATPYNINCTISAISSTTMTFNLTTAQAALVTVGDWIALAEYTPIPEIPFELSPLLSQATVIRGLAAFGDTAKKSDESTELQNKYLPNAIELLSPRTILGKKKVVGNWRRL